MRRILTTLMILLAVIVAGLTSLVLLVNPNDFRAYMVHEVAERSGYQLELDGPLRWHVWPQLSILSGRMTLTARGAEEPVIRADNMRLDVALLPLLSHQLQVKQVMLKGAVIQLTPKTEAVRDSAAPVVPHDNTLPLAPEDRGWSYDVRQLQVADSVLFFQHENGEQVTVRDIRLQMEQDENHRATVDFSGRVNRDQRDLALNFSATVQGGDYPHSLKADFSQLSWQLRGAELPPDGINGQGSLQASWQEDSKTLRFDNLNLMASGSTLTGNGSVVLGERPDWSLDLHATTLNLDSLLASSSPATDSSASQQGQSQTRPLRPVIADSDEREDYQSLRGFTGRMALSADQLQWRGLNFTQVQSEISNKQGLLTVSKMQGSLDGGQLSLPGTLDARGDTPQATFQPALQNVEIGSLIKAFNYSLSLTGKLSLTGEFSGARIDADDFRRRWQGQAQIQMTDTRTEGLNFQQLVQQAVERSTNVRAQENYDNATRLDAVSSQLTLDNGLVTLNRVQGQSDVMAMTGEGQLDLQKENCDMRFNVRVLGGWKGEGKLIDRLKQTAIPLRIYGDWQSLSYSLQVDQILRKQLQDEAKQRLNDWVERNKGSKESKDAKKLLDKL
ncbi:TPA: outer membrane assembly protein AsmA [Klebsiella quasipneumoniae subsp. quasipneumoniae]|uniref:outer membrane assembly protein AsmA n=1 Tax=Klebsiella quasipneumoniae TaxID=1463165 RepID=UPI00067C8CE8|nr:outer membrane assembly protein AsmA [Klebsiella quasipneumoniae]KNG99293.1 assembly protein [Klebsiella quasipneumoniae subsp. quasipneumoniae]MBZ6707330.1 outer membrane assembly protein AsmA [Klebsiella quasipneumoniae]MCJ1823486.1 outer membrane assembly protein AsmA [Klebsiella quasipneumoniae subsp. quasipneumoniae]MCK6034680.1 outer membrane assembly protein AsmA [Klebsiella quasipneumoniae]MDI3071516.1 outer membrane assembly protein AsmA [Klebsiella quasipneumoniae]